VRSKMDREPKEPQLDNPQLDEECNFKAMTDEEIESFEHD
tara:strand:- start:361 stop:480 length:120 start_codon:yes stop_codon:yes gene_type:complete